MKRRKPKGKSGSVATVPQPTVNTSGEATILQKSTIITGLAETAGIENHETFELSAELQTEIENFNNSFHVQRHTATPPASSKAPAAIEPPSPRGASAPTPLPPAADR